MAEPPSDSAQHPDGSSRPSGRVTSSSWGLVRHWFEQAQEWPAQGRRERLLAACGDAALVDEVLSLLEHSIETPSEAFLAAPAVVQVTGTATVDASLDGQYAGFEGLRLGPWRLAERMGVGGMGEVFRATRDDGAYDGDVAIKLLKATPGAGRLIKRFAQEQRALARLSHPHVARLFDAGLTPSGMPYFVMERVDGQPIDQACKGLPTATRLGYFLQLADAVSHAHRNLLVHRDLKPSNVLVDRSGQVKLLDFGIAKALEPEDGPRESDQTQAGDHHFSPNYASPEQVKGEPVGTATDIYSLGVLLYVMLTGVRPYGRGAKTVLEAAQAVLAESPTRPSALDASTLSTDQIPDPSWAQNRLTLKGDLDNVLLKALEKDPSRRYASVDAMAQDVKAYLNGYPVSARPATWGYRARKAIERNQLAAGAAAAAVTAMIAGTGVSLWQAHEARQARDEAQRRLSDISAMAREVVLQHTEVLATLSSGAALKEKMLLALVQRLEPMLGGADTDLQVNQLLALAQLAEVQGSVTTVSVNKPEEALKHADQAISLAQQVRATRPQDARVAEAYAKALRIKALAVKTRDKPLEGIPLLQRADALLLEALPSAPEAQRRDLQVERAQIGLQMAQAYDHPSTINLKGAQDSLAEYQRTEALLRQIDQASPAQDTGNLLSVLHGGRALSHARLGDLDAAALDAVAAVRYRQRAVDAEPGNVVYRDGLVREATNGGVVLLRATRDAEALTATRTAWEQVQALARENGPGNQWLASRPMVASHHARALLANGLAAEAVPVALEAVQMREQKFKAQVSPNNERLLAWTRLQWAKALWRSGQDKPKAEAVTDDVLRVLGRLAAEPKAYDALLNLGEAVQFKAETVGAGGKAGWLQRSAQAYAQANELRELRGDHLRAWNEVKSSQ